MHQRILHTLIFILAIFIAKAEDGSKLWLRYEASSPTKAQISTVGVSKDNPTVQIIAEELAAAAYDKPVTLKLKKSSAHPESYTITTDKDGIAIQSPSTAGLLYGTYHLLRLKALGKSDQNINLTETPAYDLRVLNHWDNLNGTVERGYAGQSIWKWDELPSSVSPRYKQYARACASVGINSAVLNNVNASPQMLSTETLRKVKVIADGLRPYGIRTYLSINFASPKVIGGLPTADPLDPAVQNWWKAKVKEIYTLIPDFGGFLVKANSEGEPGPGDYGRTHAEGANMLADAVKPYRGNIMWRAFVYKPSSPDRAKQAYEEFTPLDGLFRDNVIIQIKNGPVDFQPREPFSPLFGAMPKTQQMIEFQITQEYLGASNHLVYLAPLFKECLDANTYRGEGTISAITSTAHHGVSAIAGVANIGDDTNWCGHDFAQANWYAFGRLAWNPSLTSRDIADEWLKLTFNTDPKFVEKAKKMMLGSREAAVDYMMPIGLHHIFAGEHHYGPEPWYYIEGMRLDWSPLYYHKASADSLGFDRTVATGTAATAEYASPLKEIYENRATCPVELLLWFHRVGWNDKVEGNATLWETLCSRYSRGVEKARAMQKDWDALQPYVDAERFAAVQDKLKIQTHDAQWWKDACLLYFQEFNQLPFPENMERPVYTLPQLKKVKIPLGLYGCPTRDQLP